MDWAGWALFGLLATTALTAVMIAAQLAGLTRLDLPLVLGTLVTEDPDRARVAGFFIHLVVGQGFALGYAAAFALLHRATWWLGALLGMLHVAVALLALLPLLPGVHPRMASHRAGPASTAVLEPPGLLALNYGDPDPGGRDRRPPRLRHRRSALLLEAPMMRCSVSDGIPATEDAASTVPIADYGLLGDTRTAALVSSTARSTGSACPGSTANPCSAGWSAGREAGTFRAGPAQPATVVEPSLPADTAPHWRRPGRWASGRLTLTEGMVAEVAGRLLPATCWFVV